VPERMGVDGRLQRLVHRSHAAMQHYHLAWVIHLFIHRSRTFRPTKDGEFR
jgi:hypothetical protein